MRGIFILILCIICIQYADAQDDEYAIFLNRLTESDSIIIDSNVIEYNTFWRNFLNTPIDAIISANKNFAMFKSVFGDYKRPNTRPFFERKLMLGEKFVIEEKTKDANDCIGFAKCINGVPYIYFALKADPAICSEALVFFREHEFAHFKLGHSGCGVDAPFKDSHLQEFEADLEAAKTILTFSEGTRIIDFVIATFFTLNIRQSRYHPSTYERAANLFRNLNTNVIKYK